MRKSTSFLVFILFCLIVSMTPAFAEDVKTTLTPNTVVNGYLNRDTDYYYSYTLSEPGYVQIVYQQEASKASSPHSVFVELWDTNKERMDLIIVKSDDTSVRSTYQVGLPAGTYTVFVDGSYLGGYYEGSFALKLNYTPSNNWERENNNTKSKANTINLNQKISGGLTNYDNMDWFEFTVGSYTDVYLQATHESDTYYGYFSFDLQDASTKKLAGISSGPNDTSVRETDVVTLTPGTYNVTVHGGRGQYSFEVITSSSNNYDDSDDSDSSGGSSYSDVPIYRLYNMRNGEHLYTSDKNEANTLSRSSDWNNEGTAWYAPSSGQAVYRLYSPVTGVHLFTTDRNEVSTLSSRGWSIDNKGKPLFYSGGSQSIYRLYNPVLRQHLLTNDLREYNTLPGMGWQQEGAKLQAK